MKSKFTLFFLIFTSTVLLFTPFGLQSQTDSLSNQRAFHWNVLYTGDLVSNFDGGIKTGTMYLGLANLKFGLDFEKAGWWNGGKLSVNMANTHGGQPSLALVGDFQGVSNIEAGNLTFLFELWYKQRFGSVIFTLGLQDLNVTFATTENGALFNNSSFGIQSSIADNIPTPIFPLTGLGAMIEWEINKDFSVHTALFDGTPDDFENNPYNINWKLSNDDGYLTVCEIQIHKSLIKDLPGTYKIGGYFHEHNDNTVMEQENGGVYFIADQTICSQGNSNLSLFSQIGFSPKSKNNHNHYYSLGLNCTGIFGRLNDIAGLAVAYAGIDNNAVGSETAVELTYQLQLNKYIYLRPDIQYIINPAGTDLKLKNALVGFLRIGIKI